MAYVTFALAGLGVVIGLLFSFRALLPIIVLVALIAICWSIFQGNAFVDTALILFKWQAILQGSYFAGLVIRAVFSSTNSRRVIF